MENYYEGVAIISGFAGIGKTTAAREIAAMTGKPMVKVIDFDSAMYKENCFDTRKYNYATGQYEEIDWVEGYVREIRNIAEDYELSYLEMKDSEKVVLLILVSCHDTVREEMDRLGLDYTIVVPGRSVTAKNAYIKRLSDRYEADPTDANKRALEALQAHYDDFLSDILDYEQPEGVQIAVLDDNATLLDFIKDTYSKSIMDMLFGAMGGTVPEVSPEDFIKKAVEDGNLHITMGQRGEVIAYTDPIPNELYRNEDESLDFSTLKGLRDSFVHVFGHQSANNAFAGSQYIILSKFDAQAILNCLNSAIERLRSGEREDDDREVFGDDAIAYERLIDALDGFNYVMWNYKKAKEAYDAEIKTKQAEREEAAKNSPFSVVESRIGVVEPVTSPGFIRNMIDDSVKQYLDNKETASNKETKTEES